MKKKTRYVILGLLRDECMTGYEIKRCIDLRMSFFWNESYGQIYPELNAMVKEGLLTAHTEASSEKREKIVYQITDEGISVFHDWMKSENEKDTIRSESLLKFFLADDANKEDMVKHLESFYNSNVERLNLYKRFKENLEQFKGLHNNHKYILRMLELGIKQQELYCDWSVQYQMELQGEQDEKTKG